MLSKGSLTTPKIMQASKSVRGLNSPVESSDSKAAKVLDRKSTSKSSYMPERRMGRSLDMQPQFYQLQEELRKVKDEKTKALEDLEELRSNKKMSALSVKEEREVLDRKVEKAKESERKMLESLISQTKQFEQTKISLEEAKLEIRSLQDTIKSLEKDVRESKDKQQSSVELICAREEIAMLRNELKSATQAEEKSKKAMDDLALALKEVTTEANQVKARLTLAQSELDKVKSEAEKSQSLVMMTDGKLRAEVEESERLKLESEDLVALLKVKDDGFMKCMKTTEEENSKLKMENSKLIESLRGSREETCKLRDILKQAVNEATVVKEALELTRTENSRLNDLLSEKENSLQSIKQEYECLKVSEAAAVDSVKELKGFLAAPSDVKSATKLPLSDVNESEKVMKFSPERLWTAPTKPKHGRRHSIGALGKFAGPTVGMDEPSPLDPKNPMFSSFSNVTASRVTSSIYSEDRDAYGAIDFDYISGTQSFRMDGLNGSEKKKKPMLKKFGEMLRRRSFHIR